MGTASLQPRCRCDSFQQGLIKELALRAAFGGNLKITWMSFQLGVEWDPPFCTHKSALNRGHFSFATQLMMTNPKTQHFGGRPERVIDTLLEGRLPPELASVDPSQPLQQPPPPTQQPQRQSRPPAAGVVAATGPVPDRNGVSGGAAGIEGTAPGGATSWQSLAADSAALAAEGARVSRAAPPPSPSLPSRRPHRVGSFFEFPGFLPVPRAATPGIM